MKKKLIIILLVVISQINAQPFVLIPDVNFRAHLQNIIPAAMNGNSLNINSLLVTTSTQTMHVGAKLISNLNGIQYFSSLKFFECSTNLLTNLPTLPNSLKILYCDNNALISLPTLPNSLQVLLCYSNSLTTLPALPNSLKILNCSENNISCFPAFPDSLTTTNFNLSNNPYNCLPNYVLPAMNNYTTTPLCAAGNSNGCITVGINEINSDNENLIIYPNPANNQLIIETKSTEKQVIKLFDINGNLLFNGEFNNNANIDLGSLNEGIYHAVIKIGDTILSKTVIIHR